jgi:pyruvate dehydrogenase E2 component (dihydrolipoamide acetyltransferase)
MLDDLKRRVTAAKKRPEPPPLAARLEKPSPMRRAIAAAMTASSREIPAFQVECTVDAASLIARREADKAAGAKVSYGDYIARATALAIRRFPAFAAAWQSDGIAYKDRVHVGFAVSVPGGLVTPVVRDCDRLSPREIAAESARLVERARANQLTPEEYSGAVFTLSNLGAFPVDCFVAIVPPGQSGILAIGRIRDEVVVRGGGIFPAKLMSLTLSADHRIIDGADGAAFVAEMKTLLEDAAGL